MLKEIFKFLTTNVKMKNRKEDKLMSVSVFKVAKYILSKSVPGTDRAVDNLKLQKLVYYAQAWHLAITGGKLFEESIEAWIHGPVCPALYYEYRNCGFSEIPKYKGEVEGIPKESIEIIDDVWKAYGAYTGRYLENLSHNEEPWIKARGNKSEYEYSDTEIDPKLMAEYYSKL